MSFFNEFTRVRKEQRDVFDERRKAYEDRNWAEYRDADFNLIGSLEKLICLLAIAKSKLAIICPLEARACYSMVFAILSNAVRLFWETFDRKFLTTSGLPVENDIGESPRLWK